MSGNANFASTPFTSFCQASVANTARDGTGTLVDLTPVAPAAGRRVDAIELVAAGAVTAGMVRLFLHDGTTNRLWKEIPVTAITPSASVPVWSALLMLVRPLILASGWRIRMSVHNAEAINGTVVTGGDFT